MYYVVLVSRVQNSDSVIYVYIYIIFQILFHYMLISNSLFIYPAMPCYPLLQKKKKKKESACQCRRHNESWVRSLGGEDPLEKEMATHSNILAWRILWAEEPGRLHTVHGVTKSQTWLKWLSMHEGDCGCLVGRAWVFQAYRVRMERETERSGFKETETFSAAS